MTKNLHGHVNTSTSTSTRMSWQSWDSWHGWQSWESWLVRARVRSVNHLPQAVLEFADSAVGINS